MNTDEVVPPIDARGDRYAQADKGWAAYDTFTKQASDNSRKLAFTGLALVLLLGGVAKTDFGDGRVIELSAGLKVAGLALIGSLLADILQYIWGAGGYFVWSRREEVRLDQDSKAQPTDRFPAWINFPTNGLFVVKIGLVAIAYATLFWHLAFAVS